MQSGNFRLIVCYFTIRIEKVSQMIQKKSIKEKMIAFFNGSVQHQVQKIVVKSSTLLRKQWVNKIILENNGIDLHVNCISDLGKLCIQ